MATCPWQPLRGLGKGSQEGRRRAARLPRAAAVTKDPRSITFLLQRISVTVQQGNAACIIGTLSNGPNPDELLF